MRQQSKQWPWDWNLLRSLPPKVPDFFKRLIVEPERISAEDSPSSGSLSLTYPHTAHHQQQRPLIRTFVLLFVHFLQRTRYC